MLVNKWVKWWLLAGLIMVFIQVIVGGITRLTESGLSITKWEIVSGTLFPISEESWIKEFDLYKETPQYKEINEGMSLSDFKFIYFWEWVHRFWARIMGFVFIIPFTIFYFKKLLNKSLLKDLFIVFILAATAASFGWIMVASGLVKRPWVNAYKLSFHLCIAFCVFAYLLWTYLKYTHSNKLIENKYADISFQKDNLTGWFLLLLWLQLFLGGIMSGMKAGVYYPTWPLMNGEFIPSFIFNFSEWSFEKFNNYDAYNLMPALIQVSHRITAYGLFFYGLFIYFRHNSFAIKGNLSTIRLLFLSMLLLQIVLGIITVITCKGEVPVLWGVLHQAGALLLLTITLILRFKIKLRVL